MRRTSGVHPGSFHLIRGVGGGGGGGGNWGTECLSDFHQRSNLSWAWRSELNLGPWLFLMCLDVALQQQTESARRLTLSSDFHISSLLQCHVREEDPRPSEEFFVFNPPLLNPSIELCLVGLVQCLECLGASFRYNKSIFRINSVRNTYSFWKIVKTLKL